MRKYLFFLALLAGLLWSTPEALGDWSQARRLTWTAGDSRFPAMAMDSSDAIHVVWEDDTPGNREIYYKRSEDSGATWSGARRLTWTAGDSHHPAIGIDSNDTIHIFWDDDTPGGMEIYYKKSQDGGTTWSATRRITWTPDFSYEPVVAIDSNDTIHIVWYDYASGDSEIYYKQSQDGGTTWSASRRLTWTSGASYSPAMDTTSSVHVVWEDETPGLAEIYYKSSPDSGSTWSATRRITWTSGGSYMPVIAVDSNDHIHVAWYDNTPGNLELYYKRSEDDGSTWSSSQRLTWTSGGSRYIALAVGSGNALHMAWYDDTPGASEIYYKNSPDGGSTWNSSQRLTWTSDTSSYPALAIESNNTLHLVWEDRTPGNWEIYYKKGT
jgi:BNR repeat-like domain